jgi:hypothetical protein
LAGDCIYRTLKVEGLDLIGVEEPYWHHAGEAGVYKAKPDNLLDTYSPGKHCLYAHSAPGANNLLTN